MGPKGCYQAGRGSNGLALPNILYILSSFDVKHNAYDVARSMRRCEARCEQHVSQAWWGGGGRPVVATLAVTCKMTVAGSADGRRCRLAQRGTASAAVSSLTAASLLCRSSGPRRSITAVWRCTRRRRRPAAGLAKHRPPDAKMSRAPG